MDIEHIKQMTRELGEGWGYAHACRVLKLVDIIGADFDYNHAIIEYAVYLHDWGAFPKYLQTGVDHALRSRQVAESEILPNTSLPTSDQAIVAEAIELHDYRDPRPHATVESLLLREADWLDMLGVIGIVRVFAWGPNDLQVCYKRAIAKRNDIQKRLSIPKAQEIGAERIARMDTVFRQLLEESFGIL